MSEENTLSLERCRQYLEAFVEAFEDNVLIDSDWLEADYDRMKGIADFSHMTGIITNEEYTKLDAHISLVLTQKRKELIHEEKDSLGTDA